MLRHTLVIFVLSVAAVVPTYAEELGLRVADGFEVARFAGNELATNIYSMTIDSQGRVVVSGPQYVKTLHDDDRDGVADRATVYTPGPYSGAMGMYFDGPSLICSGDAGVLRYVDADNDGVADGRPQVLIRSAQGEHGTHGITKGPDGWYYVVCGNDAGIGEKHVQTDRSPVREPESGCIIRFSPDGKKTEVVAHGFRNPYDGDFNSLGHFFTYDSDGERDQYLPWYAPTRVFDVAVGMHHGWLLSGWKRSWNRPEYYFDNVQRLAEIRRGSPTGVVAYRHRQFPDKYRDGIFVACWSFGRVYFCPLQIDGATYTSKPETILETTGTVGFSPVDLAVGPEGDLFVAVGGRGTEGGVFRVRHTGSTDSRRDISISGVPFDMLAGVLNAPQPLSSWSRAEWVPYAKEIGRPAFVRAAGDNRRTAAERIRAIEIVVELFQGLLVNEVPTLIADDQPQVVARAAWALGRAGQDAETERQLAQLTHHADPRVQRATWEALATFTQLTKHSADARWSVLSDRVERRIRAAAHLADVKRYTRHPLIPLKGDTTGPRAVAALWQMKHRGTLSLDHFGQAAATASATQDNALRLECIRLCQIALNDVNSAPAKPDVYAGYLPNGEPKMGENIRRWAQTMASIFPTDDADTNRELSRLLGMVRLKDPALLARIVAQIAEKTSVAEDVHYLIVLSLLEGNRDAQVTRNTAASLCQLHHKLRDLELYTSRNWPLRVGETLEQLCSKDPALADAVLQDPQFGLAEHSFLLERMSGDTLRKGSESLVESILDTDEEDRVSAQLVNTIARLPHQKSFPLLRKLWPIVLLRDAIVIQLASHPKEQDRSHLAEGLDSVQPEVVLAAAKALAQLRDSQAEGEWKAAASALRRACLDPAQKDSRSAIQALLQHWTSEEIRVSEQKQKDLRDQYQPWFDLIVQRFPQLATVNDSRDVVAWQERAAEIDWSVGDADAGKEVFRQRACAGCHGRTNRIGPSLAEVGKRSSIADLLIAIVDPHRDVSPAYQATLLETATGKTYRGVIVYESPDATLLQTSAETTIRITGQEILSQRRSALSLMPTGLLAGATDRQVADLVAYLRSLRE